MTCSSISLKSLLLTALATFSLLLVAQIGFAQESQTKVFLQTLAEADAKTQPPKT